ncbi:ketol-acid reductoisomerase [Candidatus Tachikawaea gelatinosa]|uniref:Ketol-acid reductoisomerase n=2 Tax=Candidatus Tachikawaea gelatinosa TaxID=1410383 RepID=A0A090AQ16_9ENTR|nr:ketol-acid reductoisomerase [Candidatus Tachikawaea gelatinosa]
MKKSEFFDRCNALKNSKIVILGCGSQGLNQGLNMRDSGLQISYALRQESIDKKKDSWKRATNNNFLVGNYKEIIPNADFIINLTPDKQHSHVIKNIIPLMKKNAFFGYSHGFNIVEMGESIRKDITVIMVAPKSPGTEVREEYKRNFGVPALIAVHEENDPKREGFKIAKAWAFAIGCHRAGVLESSFIAEVKSDLMGEQTILCGMLQTGSLLCYEKLLKEGYDCKYAGNLVQLGWEKISESLKLGGITLMMDRLSNHDKIRAYKLSEQLKIIMRPLFEKHMDDIITGSFSELMIKDWNNNDKQLLKWRKETQQSNFEQVSAYKKEISEQEYYDHGIVMIAMLKSGIELSFEVMIETGIKEESAYYESLHELPLIANTIARKRLYEMNTIISDTAEYGNYLFSNSAFTLLQKFMNHLKSTDLGKKNKNSAHIDNFLLKNINESIYNHSIERIGRKLRQYMDEKKV